MMAGVDLFIPQMKNRCLLIALAEKCEGFT